MSRARPGSVPAAAAATAAALAALAALPIVAFSCASSPPPPATHPAATTPAPMPGTATSVPPGATTATPPPPPAGAPPIPVAAPPPVLPPKAPELPPGPATPAPPPAAPARPRAPDAIIADYIKATGGAEAWANHKTLRIKIEMTFQGMGITGVVQRHSTRADKSLVVTELPGLGGLVREGSNGKVFWSEDPLHGLRRLEGVEAEQARADSVWNPDGRIKELYPKIESKIDAGPSGAPLECLVLTPKLGKPITSCYDPVTHLQVMQKGLRTTPEGDTPFYSTVRDWRDVGGVKMPFVVETQAGPITFAGRMVEAKFDEPMDEKMFEPPAALTGGKKKPKSK